MPTVEQNLQRLALDGVLGVARQGMQDGITTLLDVATNELYPMVPHDTGALSSSGTAFVDRKLVKVNPNVFSTTPRNPFREFAIENPTPAMKHDLPIENRSILGVVVFNQDYAEDVHEAVEVVTWTTPGTGAKFLESKVVDVGSVTVEAIADRLRAYIGS